MPFLQTINNRVKCSSEHWGLLVLQNYEDLPKNGDEQIKSESDFV